MNLLENDRIRLRAMEPEDIDRLYEWENDSTIWSQGDTVSPYSKYALKQYIAEWHRNIYELRQMHLAIDLRESGETVGMIDLYDFDMHNRKAGTGIIIGSPYRKQGLGTESMNLLIGYAFSFLKLHQLYAYISMENEASQRLFKRCGFSSSGILKECTTSAEGYNDVLLMQLINKNQL